MTSTRLQTILQEKNSIGQQQQKQLKKLIKRAIFLDRVDDFKELLKEITEQTNKRKELLKNFYRFAKNRQKDIQKQKEKYDDPYTLNEKKNEILRLKAELQDLKRLSDIPLTTQTSKIFDKKRWKEKEIQILKFQTDEANRKKKEKHNKQILFEILSLYNDLPKQQIQVKLKEGKFPENPDLSYKLQLDLPESLQLLRKKNTDQRITQQQIQKFIKKYDPTKIKRFGNTLLINKLLARSLTEPQKAFLRYYMQRINDNEFKKFLYKLLKFLDLV